MIHLDERPRAASSKRVRFRDLSVTDPAQKARLLEAVDIVLTHGQLLLGPEVDRFEQAIAQRCGTKHCVGVASGTDALYVALRALKLGPGDEVITTPLSWIATLNAIHLCGCHPVFVDITDDFNIDVDRIEEKISPRTKAIVPVHFTGRMCDMPKLVAVAQKHGLLVIEDAAQAFGAHLDGQFAASFGDVSAFSFNPMKVLAGYGEAGAVLTNDPAVYERLLALRYLGTVNREVCHDPCLNAKIDTLQAAMMLVSLEYVDANIARRIAIAETYTERLHDVVQCPPRPQSERSRNVFFDFTIIAEDRDELRAFLDGRGIETKIKHPILMPDQPAYAHLARAPLPVAERVVRRILSLPIHEKMTAEDVDYVAASVRAFYRGRA